ncbi:Ycf66 family protein [Candidatus Synechococcus calcipolaris G9]|uniref:Ycf66 family protein n=1 Tax=Candidatus Synechococcus calcipolaris G9 TaxID=1497997 RepID=A0ABT6EZX0_9SYNE|nr:Ycf66 family protein [Candidatus Synechococcus calcipolaris]MDG2991159.1 Ycf66 family protein [Candidatus Synechococcus calcipolaris G9]
MVEGLIHLSGGLNHPLLGQIVNVGLGPAGIMGIGLAVGGAALYFLRSMRPELARDHDIFFAAVSILCGGILFFQGWRLDPILLFGQFLLTGSAAFFAVESIRLRSVATEQARRNTPIVDEDRPVSRTYTYRAELEELEPYDDEEEDEIPLRRIRGSRDTSRSRYADDYEQEEPPVGRLPSRRNPPPRPERPERSPSPRRSRPAPSTYEPPVRDADVQDEPYRPPSRRSVRPSDRRPPNPGNPLPTRPDRPTEPPAANRPRRRRPRPRPEASNQNATDYVPYQPIDSPGNDEIDNSDNFDDNN